MVERYKVELGCAIARRRKELGMTQKDLADATHYKEAQSVSRWERGENIPSDLDVVANALKWTLADLVAGIEAPNRKVARQFGLIAPGETPDLTKTLSQPSQLEQIERKLDAVLVALVPSSEQRIALFEQVVAEAAEVTRQARARDAKGRRAPDRRDVAAGGDDG